MSGSVAPIHLCKFLTVLAGGFGSFFKFGLKFAIQCLINFLIPTALYKYEQKNYNYIVSECFVPKICSIFVIDKDEVVNFKKSFG